MVVSRSTRRTWMVPLEVVDEDGGGTIDRAAFVRLTESWADSAPTGLYSVGRYALQVTVEAASPALALSSVIWSWKDALRRAGLPE